MLIVILEEKIHTQNNTISFIIGNIYVIDLNHPKNADRSHGFVSVCVPNLDESELSILALEKFKGML